MSELKPCPFCGGNNCGVRAGTDEIWCVCGGHSPHGWNSRPIEDALRAENEIYNIAISEIYAATFIEGDADWIKIIQEIAGKALKEVIP